MINFEYTYTKLPEDMYSKQPVYKYPNAKLLILNNNLANDLGLNLDSYDEKELLNFLLGYTSSNPIAQAYAGHQFGNFTILGDGRAILLGEYKKPNGELVDFHLKGAGFTDYSRGGDGKAALGPMLREYIVSEAMHNLGIPTSRILAVITTGENIQRNNLEQGAIALRVASSHIRVGTFQYAAVMGKEYSQKLLEYTVKRHHISDQGNIALNLLDYVIDKQSSLITEWERVGFIHGVMNTDNMTISGETIDYGPCAFMDNYDPETVFSSIDRNGRYAFSNQASIAGWNIARLAESLLSQIDKNQDNAINMAQDRLEKYSDIYKQKWKNMFIQKLGLANDVLEDDEIISKLLIDMNKNDLDYTNTFKDLAYQKFTLLGKKGLKSWLELYKASKLEINFSIMKEANPVVIPRNHQVEKAIKSAELGKLGNVFSLLEALKNPYLYDNLKENYINLPKEEEKVRFTFCGT